ncbi:short-chain dehydrogenase [Oceanicola sp. 22II-s10i]|uniref:SDR family NAD(P)-dependent oxidoreductase n=1 Tax=Oceanicola sp. 22II-s10i TaxID=1317116 RepID=UPI000B52770A|nr:SDR family NAD(P)-dependent oxidoreductase [Oceanicola sp. 22II-s10i]OWU83050.1 short-chain dehydrogenase [Oceanicola sp. 22II-s10i]
MDGLLSGRVAIITGAGRDSGIGFATAQLFIAHGARVVICDLAAEAPEATAARLGEAARAAVCDVTDAASCRAAVETAVSAFGRLDVVVNNAGVTQRRTVAEVTAEDYDLVTDVVLRGTLLMTQAALPHLSRDGSGSIVNVSSLSAQQGGGIFGGPHYCAAKAGVLGLTRAMAKEFGPEGIRANAITPGLIMTDFSRRGPSADAGKIEAAKDYPLGRPGSPADIANAALYLASDLSSYVTGITLPVNGGSFISGG